MESAVRDNYPDTNSEEKNNRASRKSNEISD